MSNPQHPALDDLIGYMEAPPGESDRKISLHLAKCDHCRSHVNNLILLKQTVKSMAHRPAGSSAGALRSEDEKAIVGDKLTAEQINHIKSDKQRLRAALYLSSRSNAMSVLTSKTNMANLRSETPKASALWWKMIAAKLPQWEYAALAASLLVAVVLSVNLMKQDVGIVAYSDNPVLVFKQINSDAPGIGFFSDALNVSQAYAGIQFSSRGNNTWAATWPPITDAENYLFQLYRISKGKTELLFEKRTPNAGLSINNLSLSNHTRYEWKLSGNTKDQRRYSASGGFVIQ